MKFCTKCGKQLLDEAVLCPGCGCMVNGTVNSNTQHTRVEEYEEESPGLANVALVMAFLCPIVGLILGIVSAAKYRDPDLKRKGVAAIPASICFMIAGFIILFAAGIY